MNQFFQYQKELQEAKHTLATLNENTLFANKDERDSLVKDKQAVANAFWINTLGIIGLYAISSRKGAMKTYFSDEEARTLHDITDNSNDLLVSIKLMQETGGITQVVATQLTRYILQLKNKKITSKNFSEADVLAILQTINVKKQKPSFHVVKIVDELLANEINLKQAAVRTAQLVKVKKKELLPYGNEFYSMAKIYQPLFKQVMAVATDVPVQGGSLDAKPEDNGGQIVKADSELEKKKWTREEIVEWLATKMTGRGDLLKMADEQGIDRLDIIELITKYPREIRFIEQEYIGPDEMKNMIFGPFANLLRTLGQKYFNGFVTKILGQAFHINGVEALFTFMTLRNGGLIPDNPFGSYNYGTDYDESAQDNLKHWIVSELERNLGAGKYSKIANIFWLVRSLQDLTKAEPMDFVVDAVKTDIGLLAAVYFENHPDNVYGASYYVNEVADDFLNLLKAEGATVTENGKVFDVTLPKDMDAFTRNIIVRLSKNFDPQYKIQKRINITTSGDSEKLAEQIKEYLVGDEYQNQYDFWTSAKNNISSGKEASEIRTATFRALGSIEDYKLDIESGYLVNLVNRFHDESENVYNVSHPHDNSYLLLDALYEWLINQIPDAIKNAGGLTKAFDMFDGVKAVKLTHYRRDDSAKAAFLKAFWESGSVVERTDALYSRFGQKTYTVLYELEPLNIEFDKRGMATRIVEDLDNLVYGDKRVVLNKFFIDGLTSEQKKTVATWFAENYHRFQFDEFISHFWKYGVPLDEALEDEDDIEAILKEFRRVVEAREIVDFKEVRNFFAASLSDSQQEEILDVYLDEIRRSFDANGVANGEAAKMVACFMDAESLNVLLEDDDELQAAFFCSGASGVLPDEMFNSLLELDLDGFLPKEVGPSVVVWEDVLKRATDRSRSSISDTAAKNIVQYFIEYPELTVGSRSLGMYVTENIGAILYQVKDEPELIQELFDTLEDDELKLPIYRSIEKHFLLLGVGQMAEEESASIKPFEPLDTESIQRMVVFNKIEVPFTENPDYDNVMQTITDSFKRESQKATEVVLSEEEKEQLSVKLDKWNNYRHGGIAPKILRVFDVAIPKHQGNVQSGLIRAKEEGWGENTERVIKPAYHGTSDIGAAMITRYGFNVVSMHDEAARGYVVGRMLGDGIYFSDAIDKVSQYLSQSGYTREGGQIGYIFDMSVWLGRHNHAHDDEMEMAWREAGTGTQWDEDFDIRSPEWCVTSPDKQIDIIRCYEVQIISSAEMRKLKKKYPLNESQKPSFLSFINEEKKERKTEEQGVISFLILDGMIPVKGGNVVPFDQLDTKKLPKNCKVYPAERGIVVEFTKTSKTHHCAYQFGRQFANPYNDDYNLYSQLMAGKKL